VGQYIYKSFKYPIQIGLTISGFPTFCGGAIISGVYVCSSSYPKNIFKKLTQTEWTDLSAKTRELFLERYYDWVQETLREVTDYISKGTGWAVKDNNTKKGFFAQDKENVDAEGKYREYKCTLGQAGLSKGFIIIADAINGERNCHHHISTYSLAECDKRWKPSVTGCLINPNSNRPTNVWVLAIPNDSPNNHYSPDIEEWFNRVLKRGTL